MLNKLLEVELSRNLSPDKRLPQVDNCRISTTKRDNIDLVIYRIRDHFKVGSLIGGLSKSLVDRARWILSKDIPLYISITEKTHIYKVNHMFSTGDLSIEFPTVMTEEQLITSYRNQLYNQNNCLKGGIVRDAFDNDMVVDAIRVKANPLQRILPKY